MSGIPQPAEWWVYKCQARAEAAEKLAAERLAALEAVRKAICIPHPATVGDGEVYDRIMAERIMHVRNFFRSALGDDPSPLGLTWSTAYLRERLAEHPATGYRTWDDVRAERAAKEDQP